MASPLLTFLLVIWGLSSKTVPAPHHAANGAKLHKKTLRNDDAFEWSASHDNDLYGGKTYVGKKLQLTAALSIAVRSYSDDPIAVVTLTKDVTYIMGSYRLSIEKVRFKPSTSDKLESSLITSDGGELTLDTVTFDGITTATSPLLAAIPSSMSSVVFKDITRAEITGGAGGSVFEITDLSTSLDLSGAKFDNCKCPNGKGGSIYIKLADATSSSYINLALYFKNVASDAAKTGLCTYIDYNQCTKEHIHGETLVQLAPQKKGYHMYVAKDVTEATNIYTFFESMGVCVDHTAGTAASSSKDDCGSFEKPCLTVALALESKKLAGIAEAIKDDSDSLLVIMFNPGEHSAETAASTIAFTLDSLFMGATTDPSETVLSVATIGSSAAVYTFDAKESMSVEFACVTFKASAASSTGVFLLKGAEATGYCQLQLSRVTFQNSEKTVAYSNPVIDARNGLLKLSQVVFEDITLTNCPLLRVNTGTNGLKINSANFYTLTRTSGNGVMLEETITDKSALTLSSFSYTECEATAGVGLFFFTVDKTATQNSFTFRLPGGPQSKDQHNCIIGFKADDKAYVLDNLNFKTQLSEYSDEIKRYYGVIGGKTLPLVYFTGHPSSKLYITTGTDDSEMCGWEEMPCGPFKSWAAKGTSFTLLPGKHEGTKLELTSSYDLEGDDNEGGLATTYTVTDGVTFTTSSQLYLSYLIIGPAGSFKAIKSHLIDASAGTLYLDYVEFRDIVLDGYCLISFSSISKNSYSSDSMVLFKSISRSDTVEAGKSSASVFSIDASLTSFINLYTMRFDSCSGAKGGVGGAVYISFPDSLSSISLYVDTRPFTGSVSTPDEGKYIYFDASSVTSEAFLETFEDSLRKLVADTTDHLFVVKTLKEAGKTETEENNLHKLLGITQLTLTVDTTSTGECTKDAKKCSSLSTVMETIENYGTGSGNAVTIASDTLSQEQAEFTISKGVSITGAPTKVVMVQTTQENANGGSSALMTFQYEAVSSLSKFNFHFTSPTASTAISDSAIYVTDDAQLTVSSASFTSSTASTQCYVSSSVIDASSGKLILSSVTCSYITMTGYYSLLSINTDPGCFSISSTSTFSNIITSDSGSVFYEDIEQGASVVIENAEFTSCKAPNGNGGAIYFYVEDNGILTIKNCKFTSCEAGTVSKVQSNAERYGGAIYLQVKDTPSITLDSLTVSGCKATAANGGNVLFCLYLVEAGKTVPDSFWEEMMKGIDDPADGDYVAVVVHEGDKIEDMKPIDLAEYAEDDGFPTWAIILIVVGAVVIIAVVVVIIVVCVLRSKKGKVDVDDKSAGDSDSSSAPASEEPAPSDNSLSE